jgi:hypothetical protein
LFEDYIFEIGEYLFSATLYEIPVFLLTKTLFVVLIRSHFSNGPGETKRRRRYSSE